MRILLSALILVSCLPPCWAQARPKAQTPRAPSVAPQASAPLETQKVEAPATAPPPATAKSEPGFMQPTEVRSLLHEVSSVEFRIDDLLTDVRPEKWKISDAARHSFGETLDGLHKGLATLAEWRTQFEKRPDSMYLGYQAYAAMGAILPRLEGVAHSVSEHENASLGVQYSQAEDRLFDLQQTLQAYLAYLLRNQDEILTATQSNLASCQNQLGSAMRGCVKQATPVKDVFVNLKVRRPSGEKGNAAREKPAKAAAQKPEPANPEPKK